MDSGLLLVEIKKGCRKSFQKFFNLYYQEMVNYSHRYLFDEKLSEDVVQEVFINFWENSDKIVIRSSVKGYLCAMVRNKALNELKKLRITDDQMALQNLYELEVISETFDCSESDKYEEVKRVISGMPAKMRLIFELKYLSDYSISEISEELKISVTTVKTQLYRARTRILHFFLFLIIFFLE